MSNLVVAIIATAAYQHGLNGGHWVIRLDRFPETAKIDHPRAA
jgi:hypothetical protein